ncbi:MAG: DUF268 domain-containing protein [Deltaproteobacteria bacterium]|nr:MAG: DUF268 domain-containing protein [Deltaproteobacteria bacterium]
MGEWKKIFIENPLVFLVCKIMNKITGYFRYTAEFHKLKRLGTSDQQRFPMHWKDRYPCLDDRTSTTGFDRHYIFHPAWAARILSKTRPGFHVDISSSLHFCTLVSAFIPVRFYDYRPVNLMLETLSSERADLLSLPFEDNSIPSISCMHVVEHVGLGRYGDSLDYNGDLKAIRELKRVLATGGSLLFVVPVGQPKIMFNAHRIYSYKQIIGYFSDLELLEFALIPDDPAGMGLIRQATKEMADAQIFGCGCFWFQRTE